jgi:hypothetical protein
VQVEDREPAEGGPVVPGAIEQSELHAVKLGGGIEDANGEPMLRAENLIVRGDADAPRFGCL